MLLLGLLVSCDDDSGVLADISSISIKDSRETLILTVNQTLKVDATIAPLDTPIKEATWESSNKSVATVDSSGNVKGIKGGYATITVKSEDGKIKATKHVVVGDIILKDNDNIQNKIDSADANLVIALSPGEYAEEIVIMKTISLLGPNAGISGYKDRNDEAILKGSIEIEADDVIIDGLYVAQGADKDGVEVGKDFSNTKISNNVIEGNEADNKVLINMRNISGEISGNKLYDNAEGVGGNGIWVGYSNSPGDTLIVKNNLIQNNLTGMNFNWAKGDFQIDIINNTFDKNTKHGISIGSNSEGTTFKIEGNTFIVEETATSSISDRHYEENQESRNEAWRLAILENNDVPINHEWYNDEKNPPRWYLGVKAD